MKAVGYFGVVALATLGVYKGMTKEVLNKNAKVIEPPFTSIVLCSLNEEFFIRATLESLEDQNILREYPEKFERIVVDSHSEDNTASIAEDYGWTVLQAQRGKLNARHLGIEKAKGQVIVGVDADSVYGCNWLNLLLRHFKNQIVVGVSGPRIGNPEEGALWSGVSVWLSLIDIGPIAGFRMPGQNCAFRKEAYYKVGGFNLDIDQTNMHEMVREEEIRFPHKLRQIGIVVVDVEATVFTSMRRTLLIKRSQHYRKWTEERARRERF